MSRLRKVLDPTRTGKDAELLEKTLLKLVVGQDEAIEQIVNIYQMNITGLSAPGRPVGNFLFLGPTGSGKTRTVEATAEALVNNPRAVIKIDCAEFQHSHEIAKLIGSPPGYLGHRETHPLLSQEVINQHHTDTVKLSFILFDEIEKASDALWNLLLGILDKATLTLGDNRKVDFSRAMIFMTSNLGASEMSNLMNPRLGFRRNVAEEEPLKTDEKLNKKVAKSGVEAARRKFTPEFMNRIDKVVVFKPLGEPELRRILDLELGQVQQTNSLFARGKVLRLYGFRQRQRLLVDRRNRSKIRRSPSETRHRTLAGTSAFESHGDQPSHGRRLDSGRLRRGAPLPAVYQGSRRPRSTRHGQSDWRQSQNASGRNGRQRPGRSRQDRYRWQIIQEVSLPRGIAGVIEIWLRFALQRPNSPATFTPCWPKCDKVSRSLLSKITVLLRSSRAPVGSGHPRFQTCRLA